MAKVTFKDKELMNAEHMYVLSEFHSQAGSLYSDDTFVTACFRSAEAVLEYLGQGPEDKEDFLMRIQRNNCYIVEGDKREHGVITSKIVKRIPVYPGRDYGHSLRIRRGAG